MEVILKLIGFLVALSILLIAFWFWFHDNQEKRDRKEANRNKDFWNNDDIRNFN